MSKIGPFEVDTPTCVVECPEGYSFDLTDNNKCKRCEIANCDTCVFENGDAVCATCESGFHLFED